MKVYSSMKYLLAVVLLFFIITLPVIGQNSENNGNGTSVSLSMAVAVNIISTTTVDLVTLREMNLGNLQPSRGMIEINPIEDFDAGLLRADGSPSTDVRISFLRERELVRVGGSETLMFYYLISTNQLEDQQSSEVLEPDNRDFVFNEDGELFFWIGGYVDITGAIPGQYEGEFTIEVEYL